MSFKVQENQSISKDTINSIILDNKDKIYNICCTIIENECYDHNEFIKEIDRLIYMNRMLEVDYLDD